MTLSRNGERVEFMGLLSQDLLKHLIVGFGVSQRSRPGWLEGIEVPGPGQVENEVVWTCEEAPALRLAHRNGSLAMCVLARKATKGGEVQVAGCPAGQLRGVDAGHEP
jgi:hypothetical protein